MKTCMLKKVLVCMQMLMNSASTGSRSGLIEARVTPDTFCCNSSPDAQLHISGQNRRSAIAQFRVSARSDWWNIEREMTSAKIPPITAGEETFHRAVAEVATCVTLLG
ncbi:hypothetical protein MHYP_G00038400 [Metynnis hypsauchen]